MAKIKLRSQLCLQNEISVDLQSLHPVLQKIYHQRNITNLNDINYSLKYLLPYQGLSQIDLAASRLAKAIKQQQRIVIVGDYDADGATSTALAMLALRSFGAQQASFFLPDRIKHGYGLSPKIVAEVNAKLQPELIITVDNGISSIAGVASARALGIEVLITDHHLAAAKIPQDCIIVNPNQAGDSFASKNLAGVGVIFYVMLALRRELVRQDYFSEQKIVEPNMAQFLDLVALGTVADVVPLDHNNRILVRQGLQRIRRGNCRAAIKSIVKLGNRDLSKLTSEDLGFCVGPRLNAAGRLDDMTTGVRCLLADDMAKATILANELDSLNKQRRCLEQDMQQQAEEEINKYIHAKNTPVAISLYQEHWHEGVIGLIASRIKDRLYRPTIVFTKAKDGSLKGSGRSIPGLHLRDVLADVNSTTPGLITKFGGHAMAAGLSIDAEKLNIFKQQLQTQVSNRVSASDLEACIYSDGELEMQYLTLPTAEMLQESGPWGQGFPAPLFHGEFILQSQRLVGEKHLQMMLACPKGGACYAAIAFQVDLKLWPNHSCQSVQIAYRLAINSFRNRRSLQLIVEQLNPAVAVSTASCSEGASGATMPD